MIKMSVSALESQLGQMKEEASEMARYYYKGFGATIDGILSSAEAYQRFRQRTDVQKYKETAYRLLKEVEDFYAKIPFQDLEDKNGFYPLFIVKELLHLLRTYMEPHFTNPNNDSFERLENCTQVIVEVAELYRDNFKGLLEKIKGHPDGKNFKIEIIDDRGIIWSSDFI